MIEDFENIDAKEQALIEADLWAEIEEDLEDEEVQRALWIHEEQREQTLIEQDLDFS